ncbi:hypothetical protein COCNU_scaffold017266G000010 [Cocos nucifera]|nr:hypothetical protein [Cocos nucifera]
MGISYAVEFLEFMISVDAESDSRRNLLEWRQMGSPSGTCKMKFRSESVGVAPVGPSDDQVSSSQQEWSARYGIR